VLGVSMDTSQASGYVTPAGATTPWLNELAFEPVDYRADAPRDEWSGDLGCCGQYFSQQGVARLAPAAGFAFPEKIPLPERLTAVPAAMAAGDPCAAQIYDSVGVCSEYALARPAEHAPPYQPAGHRGVGPVPKIRPILWPPQPAPLARCPAHGSTARLRTVTLMVTIDCAGPERKATRSADTCVRPSHACPAAAHHRHATTIPPP